MEGFGSSGAGFLVELLAHWMTAGWLADGRVGGGWCWLGGWRATGTPGAEAMKSGEGVKPFPGGPNTPIIKELVTITTGLGLLLGRAEVVSSQSSGPQGAGRYTSSLHRQDRAQSMASSDQSRQITIHC